METPDFLNKLDDSDLGPYEFRILMHFYTVGHCEDALQLISDVCRISIGKVSEVRKKLANGGWLEPFGRFSFIEDGYVYLAYAETGHYKIGISREPVERIRVFDTVMPIDVKIVHYFWADDHRNAESELHSRFAHKHHRGEWFNLDIQDCNYIRTIQSFSDGKFRYKGDG